MTWNLSTAYRREDIDRILPRDLRLEFILCKLHIAPIDEKVDMPVHLSIFIHQFFSHGWEAGHDRFQKFLGGGALLKIKLNAFSAGNITQGCKEVYFHNLFPLIKGGFAHHFDIHLAA